MKKQDKDETTLKIPKESFIESIRHMKTGTLSKKQRDSILQHRRTRAFEENS